MIEPARFLTAVSALLIAGGVSASGAASAAADVPSSISFASPAPLTIAFGSDWVIPIDLVGSSYESVATAPLTAEAGTVSITLSGIAGFFATDLPIQPGGVSYLSQPTDQPLLAPGSYQVSASFAPIAGSYYDASTTFTPLQLTVSPLALTPRVTAGYEAGVDSPVISASLSGQFDELAGGAPAGVWGFVVTDQHESEVFDAEVAQVAGQSDPSRVEIDSKLSSGYDYTVTTTFTPVSELASGIVVSDIEAAKFSTPTGSLSEALASGVSLPLRLAVPLGLLLLALIITVIFLAIKLRSTADQGPRSRSHGQNVLSSDPEPVEIVDMEFVGIEPLHDGSPNWTLSENDADTDAADSNADADVEPAEAPPEDVKTPRTRRFTRAARPD